MRKLLIFLSAIVLSTISISAKSPISSQDGVILGAEQTKTYLPLLKGKRIALLSNHTGIIIQGTDTIHTLDLLLNCGVGRP